MNEEQFRTELNRYMLMRREDVMYTETQIEGMTFTDYHVDRLMRENNGQWNEQRAVERIGQLFLLGSTIRKRCDHCDNIFDMHSGDNFCESCEQYTFVPAVERSSS